MILLIALIAAFRFQLATSGGQMYWPDEKLYNLSADFLKEVKAGNYREGLRYLFRVYPPRPAFIFFSAVPVAAGRIFSPESEEEGGDPRGYQLAAIANLPVSLLISVFFYCVLLHLSRSKNLALLGTAVYSLLCNTNLYIRHLVPYDYSLLFCLIALFLVLKSGSGPGLSLRTAFISGAIAALAFLTYPGYFLFLAVISTLVCFLSRRRPSRAFLFLLSAGAVILLAECLARISGSAYLFNFLRFGVKLQGSCEEGYIFAARYLREVEGGVGVLVLVLFLIYVIYFVWRKSSSAAERVLFVSAALTYVCYGTLSAVFRRLVFQGRIFHMYLPFLVWGSILTLNNIKRREARLLFSAVLLGLSLLSFSAYAGRYCRLWYPKEFKNQFLGDARGGDTVFIREDKQPGEGDFAGALFVAVNLNHFSRVYGGDYRFDPPADLRLIKSVSHPLNFKAYPFEGYSVEERRILRERDYQMRVYLRPRRKEVDLTLFTPEAKDYLLLVDLGSRPRGEGEGFISSSFNDRPLAGNLKEGLNYILLPRRLVESPTSLLTVRADPGLPPDILVELAPFGGEYVVELGRRSRISDRKFLGGGFLNTSRSGHYRVLDRAGEITIPVFPWAGRRPRLKLRVRNNLGRLAPLRLELDFEGSSFFSFTVPAEYRWADLETGLPAAFSEAGTSRLGLRVFSVAENREIESLRRRKGLLALDRLAVEWRPPPAVSPKEP